MNTTTAKISCWQCPSRTLLVHWGQPLNVVSAVRLAQRRAPGGTTQLSAMSPSDCKPVTIVQTTLPHRTHKHYSSQDYMYKTRVYVLPACRVLQKLAFVRCNSYIWNDCVYLALELKCRPLRLCKELLRLTNLRRHDHVLRCSKSNYFGSTLYGTANQPSPWGILPDLQ